MPAFLRRRFGWACLFGAIAGAVSMLGGGVPADAFAVGLTVGLLLTGLLLLDRLHVPNRWRR